MVAVCIMEKLVYCSVFALSIILDPFASVALLAIALLAGNKTHDIEKISI